VLGRWVEVRFLDNLRPLPASALDGRIKVVDLKPQYDAVPVRRGVCVDEIGMVSNVPSMQLEEQSARAPDAIV
jgi:hypothetical protein